MSHNNIIKFLVLLMFLTTFKTKNKHTFINKLENKKECNIPISYTIYDFCIANSNVKENSVLILEPFHFHNECTPGFSKYFIDLGYNVDIILHKIGITSLCIFEPINKIRFFFYDNKDILKEIAESINLKLKEYNYILIETTDPNILDLYIKLNLLNIKNSIFVFHHIDYSYKYSLFNKLKNFQIWSLGKFSIGTQVNPNFFGYIKKKRKSRKTKFFISSTINRKYNLLIKAALTLKKENLQYFITVVGKDKTFSKNNITEEISENFKFRYKISFFDLYKEVYDSDYIIINLDPTNKEDVIFKKIRVTGSVQLAYGFSKPVIINEEFADLYNFNATNSFIYKNSNFSKVMIGAINLNNQDYEKMQNNLIYLKNEIYAKSFYNVKKCLEEIRKS